MSSPLSTSVGHCGRGFCFLFSFGCELGLFVVSLSASAWGLSRSPREVGCEVEAALEQFEELGHHPVLYHRARSFDVRIDLFPSAR